MTISHWNLLFLMFCSLAEGKSVMFSLVQSHRYMLQSTLFCSCSSSLSIPVKSKNKVLTNVLLQLKYVYISAFCLIKIGYMWAKELGNMQSKKAKLPLDQHKIILNSKIRNYLLYVTYPLRLMVEDGWCFYFKHVNGLGRMNHESLMCNNLMTTHIASKNRHSTWSWTRI